MSAKLGSIIYRPDGSIRTSKGTPVPRRITFRGRTYTFIGVTGRSKKGAERSAAIYRRPFGGALVRRLEPGNFGVYVGDRFGR